MTAAPIEDEIAAIRRRLTAIDAERQKLEERLGELEFARTRKPINAAPTASVTSTSPAADKVALFRRLFGGRTDVFPARWENPKTGRSGYAPACANEWVRGVCGKPQVKCGDCPNKAFILVTGEVIECHLRGEDRVRPNGRGGDFVAGVYPAAPASLRRHHYSKKRYKQRNLIERCFNKLKQFRHIAMRFDRNPLNFLAMIKLASTRLWLRFYESAA